MKNIFFLALIILTFFLSIGTDQCKAQNDSLKYLGTAFFKIKTSEGKVIYIDPYNASDPDSADIILVTHEHSDHNQIFRVIQKPGCILINAANSLIDTNYQSFTIGNIKIKAVPAYGDVWHPEYFGVGFVVEFDSIKVYHSGGTSLIPEMADLASQNITYALFTVIPGGAVMTQAAALVQAKHDIPMHTTDAAAEAQFTSPHRLIMLENETINLTNDTTSHAARLLRVPLEYPTIQAAIDSARNSDTVLVSEGTYYENIRYKGKGIIVTSRYYLTKDWQTVRNTIIDGSTAADKNYASTVQFLNAEDSTAVLDGFTIMGGTGTKYYAVAINWQEGGGIIMSISSAIVRNNIIRNNNNQPLAGTTNGGGGGISSFYGNPTIYNNEIFSNTAGYAGGIVFNWSKGVIKNNLIFSNTGGRSEGGGGIVLWQTPQNGGIVENNTIVGNISTTNGGGISISVNGASTIPVVRNNIIWGNKQASGGQITNTQYLTGYNDIEDYSSGTNISVFPELQEGSFLISATSPCIDAGDPTAAYNDIEDPMNSGMALLPSRGTLRNDIGAFGGAPAKVLPSIDISDINISNNSISMQCSTGCQITSSVRLANMSSKSITIDSVTQTDTVRFSLNKNFVGQVIGMLGSDSISVTFHPTERAYYSDTINVFHKITGKTNPIKIVVSASSNSIPYLNKAIPNQTAYTGLLFTYRIPDSSFIDIDAEDTLTYQATGMPSWLTFNAQTHTFQGTPTTKTKYIIGVNVKDILKASASTSFTIFVVKPTTGVDDISILPAEYSLGQNYPNPFNPVTVISYQLPAVSNVILKVYDVFGREVTTLVNEKKPAGSYNVQFNASRMASGVYFYRLTTESFSQVKKMLLIK
jgi:L-ascorbate metabolism protein UlaG (beta-lactamase superfamily)